MKYGGILLVVLGVLVLTFNGINDHTNRTIIEMGAMSYSGIERRNLPIPADVGILAVIGGGALLVAGLRRQRY